MRPCDRPPTSPLSHHREGRTGTHPSSFHHPRPPPHPPITQHAHILGAKQPRNCAMARIRGVIIAKVALHRPFHSHSPFQPSSAQLSLDLGHLLSTITHIVADEGMGVLTRRLCKFSLLTPHYFIPYHLSSIYPHIPHIVSSPRPKTETARPLSRRRQIQKL